MRQSLALGGLMSMWEPASTAFAPYLNFLRALPPLGYIELNIAQIARALAEETNVILIMDEPFGALDAITRSRIQGDLLVLRRAQHRTVYFITHDVDEAVFLGDRVLVMSARPGRVVLDQEVTLSASAGRVLGEEMRRMSEFIEQLERIAGAIGPSRAPVDTSR